MLDDWLERITREPPERRAKRQLRDVGNATRDTVKELAKHPTDHRTVDILHTHTVRVVEITQRGIHPPPARCHVCGIVLPKPIGNPWSNKPGIGLLWALLIAVFVISLFPFIGWWVLAFFLLGWLVSQTFVWSLPVPGLILLALNLFLRLTGNHS